MDRNLFSPGICSDHQLEPTYIKIIENRFEEKKIYIYAKYTNYIQNLKYTRICNIYKIYATYTAVYTNIHNIYTQWGTIYRKHIHNNYKIDTTYIQATHTIY